MSDLVQGHEVQVNEALEDWRATISKFTAMMEDHAGIVHSLEASRSQYDSRQACWPSLPLALQGKSCLSVDKLAIYIAQYASCLSYLSAFAFILKTQHGHAAVQRNLRQANPAAT